MPHSIGKTRLPPGSGVDGIRRQRLSEIILEGEGYSLSGTLHVSWHPKLKVFIRNCSLKDRKPPLSPSYLGLIFLI